MSVVTVNHAIVPTLWPKGLVGLASFGLDLQVREDWRFVPDSVDKMYDWAVVSGNLGNDSAAFGRTKHLVYKSPDIGEGQECTVTLLVQGFVRECALGPLGNWTGRAKDAIGATQKLVLESRGCDLAFGAQLRALRDIRQYIAMRVGAELSGREDDEDAIVLTRRVFTRVRPVGNQLPAIPLTDVTDPFRRARRIADQWRVDHLIKTMVRRPSGEDAPVAFDIIGKGDFVEVAVTAHIEVVRTRRQHGSIITFEMHEVVRLATAKDVEGLCPKTDVNAGPSEENTTVVPAVVSLGRARLAAGGGKARDVEMGQSNA
ncbi:hypothetical protein PYCCODRAFT_1471895 [Trametes coccinea BRFM310]|uniref:Uncharacterized protein n=1 Tax=Trametes coccinea (strain BRFM310) TaxID=1353009 RepID=A0A1Y2I8C4_TRAC3|nr:hypothetical protein PYCCODRAFT_1471895 [Trametes coccinea BRFM310]